MNNHFHEGILRLSPCATVLFGNAALAQDTAFGRDLYDRHCAACHGAKLEGAPDWQEQGTDGRFQAPPHDETGHTWHHGHAMLFAYTSRGGQAYLDRGVTFDSGMRAQDMLSASVTTLAPSYSDGESSIHVPSCGCDWHRRVQLMN